MILNNNQRDAINGVINELSAVLEERDVGTREELSIKDINYFLLNSLLIISTVYSSLFKKTMFNKLL